MNPAQSRISSVVSPCLSCRSPPGCERIRGVRDLAIRRGRVKPNRLNTRPVTRSEFCLVRVNGPGRQRSAPARCRLGATAAGRRPPPSFRRDPPRLPGFHGGGSGKPRPRPPAARPAGIAPGDRRGRTRVRSRGAAMPLPSRRVGAFPATMLRPTGWRFAGANAQPNPRASHSAQRGRTAWPAASPPARPAPRCPPSTSGRANRHDHAGYYEPAILDRGARAGHEPPAYPTGACNPTAAPPAGPAARLPAGRVPIGRPPAARARGSPIRAPRCRASALPRATVAPGRRSA